MRFEGPASVSISEKSNEQNIANLKSYLFNNADNMNFLIARIETLEATVASLEATVASLTSD